MAFPKYRTAVPLLLVLLDASLAITPFRESASVVSPGAKIIRSERSREQSEPQRQILGAYLEWANTSHHDSPPTAAMLETFDSADPTAALSIPSDELYAEGYCGGKSFIRTCGFKHGPGICLKMATANGIANECYRGLCLCSGRFGCREPVCRGANDSPPFQCTAKHTPCADGSCVTLPGGDGWECWHPCNMNHRPWEYGPQNQILVEEIRTTGVCEQYLRGVRSKAHVWFAQSVKKFDPEEEESSAKWPNPESYPGDGNGETRTEAAEEAEPDPGFGGSDQTGATTEDHANASAVNMPARNASTVTGPSNGTPPPEPIPEAVQEAADEAATVAFSAGVSSGPQLASTAVATSADADTVALGPPAGVQDSPLNATIDLEDISITDPQAYTR